MIKLVRKPVSSFFGATLPNENTEVAGAAIHYDHYQKPDIKTLYTTYELRPSFVHLGVYTVRSINLSN